MELFGYCSDDQKPGTAKVSISMAPACVAAIQADKKACEAWGELLEDMVHGKQPAVQRALGAATVCIVTLQGKPPRGANWAFPDTA